MLTDVPEKAPSAQKRPASPVQEVATKKAKGAKPAKGMISALKSSIAALRLLSTGKAVALLAAPAVTVAAAVPPSSQAASKYRVARVANSKEVKAAYKKTSTLSHSPRVVQSLLGVQIEATPSSDTHKTPVMPQKPGIKNKTTPTAPVIHEEDEGDEDGVNEGSIEENGDSEADDGDGEVEIEAAERLSVSQNPQRLCRSREVNNYCAQVIKVKIEPTE